MNSNAELGQNVLRIPTHVIQPFRRQPRRDAERKAISELAESIDAVGQLMPGLVRRLKGTPGKQWELIDGERRFHACKHLGIPFRALDTHCRNEQHQFEMSVAANFGRHDHTPLEIAHAAKTMYGTRTIGDIAKIFGKSTNWVQMYLRLTQLSPAVQELLVPDEEGKTRLKVSAAFRIAELPAHLQMKAAEKVMAGGLGVVEAGLEVQKLQRKHGLKVVRRAPKKNWKAIRAVVVRLRREAAAWDALSDADLQVMFAGRTNAELETFVDQPAEAAVVVDKLCARLGRLCRQAREARQTLQRAG